MQGSHEGFGVIINKEESDSKNGKYWKFEIVVAGTKEPKTFSFWEHEEGNEFSVGDKIKLGWTEKEGTSKFGKPITYRNITLLEKEGSPKSDSEKRGGGVITPAPPSSVDSPAKRMAEQVAAVLIAWQIKDGEAVQFADMKQTIKNLEKDFQRLN